MSNPAKNNGATCDDGNTCTQIDTCQSGACIGSDPVTCTVLDQCHNLGSCDPSTGICNNPTKIDGSVCDDGNGCTQTDSCSSGICNGSNPIICTAFDQCHGVGSCDPSNGVCSNPILSDGSNCNDGNQCTLTDLANLEFALDLIQSLVLPKTNATMLDTANQILEFALNHRKLMDLVVFLMMIVQLQHNVLWSMYRNWFCYLCCT